jgi:hypothetical protein
MPVYKYVNRDFFNVWTPDMAYVLGFFAADGYMTLNKRGAYYWNIEITDKDLLESIRSAIDSDHKISIRSGHGNEQTLYRLQIGSKEMFNDLIALGFTQGKTKSLAVPSVPAIFFRDFVRGYFDGDGCVWSGYIHKGRRTKHKVLRVVFTSCSQEFLSELRRRLRLFFLFRGVLSKGNGDFYRLTYSVHDSLKVHDFMYNHPILVKGKDIYLPRKKDIFERFIAMQL